MRHSDPDEKTVFKLKLKREHREMWMLLKILVALALLLASVGACQIYFCRDEHPGRSVKRCLSPNGFSLIEVMIALGISLIMALAVVTITNNQNKALTHFRLRGEMQALMMSAAVSGDGCKSVRTAGGTPPLGVCGASGTPAVIDVLFANGDRVDAGSNYLLTAECAAGYYTMKLKSALATKVDPFNGQAIGAAFFAPMSIRFAEKAWLTGGCP